MKDVFSEVTLLMILSSSILVSCHHHDHEEGEDLAHVPYHVLVVHGQKVQEPAVGDDDIEDLGLHNVLFNIVRQVPDPGERHGIVHNGVHVLCIDRTGPVP